MPLHIEYTMGTARWYDQENGYDNAVPYLAVATLNILNGDTVFISGLHGKISRSMLRELAIWLENNKILYVFAFRKGKWHQYDIQKYYQIRPDTKSEPTNLIQKTHFEKEDQYEPA